MSEEQRVARRAGRPAAGATDLPSDRQIIDRGLAAFAELGYDGASVRELARRLGVSHNFINDRYGSKESFWKFVVDGAQTTMRSRIAEVLTAQYPDELDRMRDVLRTFHQMSLSEPNLARIVHHEATIGGSRLEHVFNKHLAPVRDAVAPLVARLVDEGRVRPIPLDVMVFAIVAMTHVSSVEPLVRLLGDGYASDPKGYIGILSDVLLTGFEPSAAPIAPDGR